MVDAARRIIGVWLAATCLSLALMGASAQTATSYVDGISDQHLGSWAGNFSEASGFTAPFPSFFADAWVGSPPSHIRFARYVVQWDVMRGVGYSGEFTNLQSWYNQAIGLGLTPELALTNYGCSGCVVPEKTEYYAREVEALHSAFPSISVFEAWNEPNHPGSGYITPVAAAHFMNSTYAYCASHGCTAVAGDFLDSESNMVKYEEEYRTMLNPSDPGNWGIHPYANTKYESGSNTVQEFKNHLPNPGGDAIWFTEVGAYYCEAGEDRGPAEQEQSAKYLVDNLIPTFKPAHVFYYQAAWPYDEKPPCNSETLDSALYAAQSTGGFVFARPAASVIFGPEGPPTVSTGSVSGLQPTQATIGGSVNPQGIDDVKYYFQYGTSTGYGSTTPVSDAGPGLNPVGESATITGLQPNTLYHYRIIATSASGMGEGNDQTFTTPAPPEVNTEPATEIQPSQATLNGYVNPHLTDTHYYFQYGTTTAYGSTVPAPPGNDVGSGNKAIPVNVIDTGLQAGVVYHFRVVASNEWGTSYGPDQVFRTAAWSAAVAEPGDEAISVCVGGTSTPTGCIRAPGAEASGTSPSVAQLSDGSAAEAVVGAGGHLDECHVTSGGSSKCWETSITVASGTSPSIAEITNGNAIVAVNTTGGLEFCEATNTGPVNCKNAGWPPHAGTSPSVAALSNGNAAVGIVDAGGQLVQCKVTYEGGDNCYETSITVASGTSPSIAEITNGNAIVAVNTTGGLEFCEATNTGPVNCKNAGWPPHAGTSPSVAALSNGNAAVGIVDAGGQLVQCKVTYEGGDNCYETSITVASGTSPSIAEITNGNAIVAVNTTGGLEFCEATNTGPVNCKNAGWPPHAGTSPSVAALSNGNAAVGIVDAGGQLVQCKVTYEGGVNCYETSITVASGTNPSIAEITNGNAIVAVNTTSGLSECQATNTGPVNCTVGSSVAAGTSPSMAALSNGNAAVSFVNSSKHLTECSVTYFAGANCYETSITVASGTSPSIAEITNGNAIVAVNTTGGLAFCEATNTGPLNCKNAGWPPHAGTSPSVAALSNGNAAVGIVDAGGQLVQCKVTYEGGDNCYETSITVASGTNPGIAEITNGNAIVAVNTTSGLQFCEATNTGPVNCKNAGWPPHAGTSPSVAALSNGNAAVGIVDAGGQLVQCKVTYEGGDNCYETSITVASGTNPGIAEITNGNAIMTVNTTSGLQFCEAMNTGPVNCANAGWEPTAGASPSVAQLSDGSAAVSFVGPSKRLDECRVTYFGGSNCYETSTTVASETNPSMAWLPGGVGE